MFLEQVLKQTADLKKSLMVLDLCAAPGGKSTHIASLLSPQSLLISNEVIRSRASILTENILKWGYPNVAVTQNDPSHFAKLEGLFDLIIVDAPCSGEGLFRKDSDAFAEWSPENVELCSLRQRRILKDVWPALKEGGTLIYSTCTYNEKEDEETMKWLAEINTVEFARIPIQPDWGIVESTHGNVIGYRFYPHKVKGEGFFISALKKSNAQAQIRLHTKNNFDRVSKKETEEISKWIKEPEDFKFVAINNIIYAIPQHHYEIIEVLNDKLNLLHAGIPLATSKHGKLVPEHGAALSTSLNLENFTLVELSLEQALKYLRKDPLELTTTQKGFAIVTYQQNPIGWINLLGNRINNLYPSNWRIRMQLPN